eukprot:5084227-Pleurochrysis_carterae.AAC.1
MVIVTGAAFAATVEMNVLHGIEQVGASVGKGAKPKLGRETGKRARNSQGRESDMEREVK